MQSRWLIYKNYHILSRLGADGVGDVRVFHPADKQSPAMYQTTSLDLAMRWVDAYREGFQWAVDAANIPVRQ